MKSHSASWRRLQLRSSSHLSLHLGLSLCSLICVLFSWWCADTRFIHLKQRPVIRDLRGFEDLFSFVSCGCCCAVALSGCVLHIKWAWPQWMLSPTCSSEQTALSCLFSLSVLCSVPSSAGPWFIHTKTTITRLNTPLHLTLCGHLFMRDTVIWPQYYLQV